MCLVALLLSLCVAPALRAEETAAEDLPAPATTTNEGAPVTEESLPVIPEPSLGADSSTPGTPANTMKEDLTLPEAPRGSSSSVNIHPDQDNLYLPPPMNSTDLPSGYSDAVHNNYTGSTYERNEASITGKEHEPGIFINLGTGWKNYVAGENSVDQSGLPIFEGTRMGLAWNLGARILNFSDIFGIWGMGGMFAGLDKEYRLGLEGQLSVGRRIQLIGGLNRVQNYVWWPGTSKSNVLVQYVRPIVLGIGAQYDFIVNPHQSWGVRGYVERDMFMLTLSFNVETAPRDNMSNLNYRDSLW